MSTREELRSRIEAVVLDHYADTRRSAALVDDLAMVAEEFINDFIAAVVQRWKEKNGQ